MGRLVGWKPSCFGGKEDPVGVENRIKNMKKIFNVVEVAEAEKVSIGS